MKVVHKFIHSLIHIEHLYSALQEKYSEAHPTPVQLKGAVLRWEKTTGGKALEKIRRWEGSLFQAEGPTKPTCLRKNHCLVVLLIAPELDLNVIYVAV